MTWRDLQGRAVTTSPSPVETERFGVSIARVVVGVDAAWDDAVDGALTTACAREEDVLVVRWPSTLVQCGAALATSKRDILPADTLMYWKVAAEQLIEADRSLPGELRIRRGASARDNLDTVVARTFGGYINHYSANPLLGRDLALEGYVHWVLRTAHDDPDCFVVAVYKEEEVGVATWCVDPAGDHVEILLAGLVPEVRGRGWYSRLLGEVGRAASGLGVPRVVISTQASNLAVQRAWVAAGFKPFAAVTTAHAVRRGLLP